MFRELAIKVRLLRTYGKKTWDIFGSLSELCTFPPRLFATEELLLAADTKSELAKSFPSLEDPASNNRDDIKYVIDGGMLIHRFTWKVGSSFCRNIRNAQLCSTAIETQRRTWLTK